MTLFDGRALTLRELYEVDGDYYYTDNGQAINPYEVAMYVDDNGKCYEVVGMI